MKDTMTFTDWTAISQIRNSIDPDMKASATVVLHRKDDGSTYPDGHIITIYDNTSKLIKYKVLVDSTSDWSLRDEEAEELLNQQGFICRYERNENPMTEVIQHQLESLLSLGFTHIVREFKNGIGQITAFNSTDGTKCYTMDNENYQNYSFLQYNDPILISGYLKNQGY